MLDAHLIPPMSLLLCPGCGHPGAAAGDFDVCICPACRGAWVHEPAEAAPATGPAARAIAPPAPGAAGEPGDHDFELVATGPATYELVRRARRASSGG